MNAEPVQSYKSFYSICKEARAMFSSLMQFGERSVYDNGEARVAKACSFDWEPEVPQGEVFNPANCYIFKRVGLRAQR